MSQAWLFLGVAIRMAQDLGLHRSVDKFPAVASNLFSPGEKEARNRVWWGCVILDKYVLATCVSAFANPLSDTSLRTLADRA